MMKAKEMSTHELSTPNELRLNAELNRANKELHKLKVGLSELEEDLAEAHLGEGYNITLPAIVRKLEKLLGRKMKGSFF